MIVNWYPFKLLGEGKENNEMTQLGLKPRSLAL